MSFIQAMNWNVIYVGVLLAWATVMLKYKLFPNADAFSEFSAVINSRGGNIVLLGFFSGWIMVAIMRGTAPQDFWTGLAFGSFTGALLKTMTGESTKARSTDTTDVTTETTSKVIETPKDPAVDVPKP